MTSNSNIIEIGFDYRKELEKAKKEIEKQLSSLDSSGVLSQELKQIQNVIDKSFNGMSTKINKELAKISQGKLDIKQFSEFRKKFEKEIDEMKESFVSLQNNLSTVQNGFDISKIINQFGQLETSIKQSNIALETLIKSSKTIGGKVTWDIEKKPSEKDTQPVQSLEQLRKDYSEIIKLYRELQQENDSFYDNKSSSVLKKAYKEQTQEYISLLSQLKTVKSELSSMPEGDQQYVETLASLEKLNLKILKTKQIIDDIVSAQHFEEVVNWEKIFSEEQLEKCLANITLRTSEFAKSIKSNMAIVKQFILANDTANVENSSFPNGTVKVKMEVSTRESTLKNQLNTTIEKLQQIANVNPIIVSIKMRLSEKDNNITKNQTNIAKKELLSSSEEQIIDKHIIKAADNSFKATLQSAQKSAQTAYDNIVKLFKDNPILVNLKIGKFAEGEVDNFFKQLSLKDKQGNRLNLDVSSEIKALSSSLKQLFSTLPVNFDKDINSTEITGNLSENFKLLEQIEKSLTQINNKKNDVSGLKAIETELSNLKNSLIEIENIFTHMFDAAGYNKLETSWNGLSTKFNSIADNNGKINLLKQKKDIQDFLAEYNRYLSIGGKKDFTDLTSNKGTQKKLFAQLQKTINNEEKLPSFDFNVQLIPSINNFKSAAESLLETIDLTKNVSLTGITSKKIDNIENLHAKLYELSGVLSTISNLKIPKIDIGVLNSNSTKQTKQSTTRQLKNLVDISEKGEGLEKFAKSLDNIALDLTHINDCVNIPNVFNGLNIKKGTPDKLAELAIALEEIKKSLEGLSGDGLNFLSNLNDITKQAETLRSLATVFKETKGTTKASTPRKTKTDEETTRDKLNNRINKIQNSFNGVDYSSFGSEFSNSQMDTYRSRISTATDMSDLEAISKELDKIETQLIRVKKLKGEFVADINTEQLAQSASISDAAGRGKIISQTAPIATSFPDISRWTIQIKTAKGEIRTLQYTYDEALGKMTVSTIKVTSATDGLSGVIGKVRKKIGDIAAYWTAQYFNPYQMINLIRQGVSVVKELDSALLDLKKTSTMTNNELSDFYLEANESAKKLGATTKEIIEQAAEWARLGFSDKKSATEMAEKSAKFKAISPGMSLEDAQSGLVSTMKAFDIGVDDVESKVMDKINVLGNKFALDNDDVIQGLKRSSAAMAAMNQSFEDTAALFTGGQEILQDSESMGTALRTLSMRIRGYDEETQELSDDLVEVKGQVADLTKTASTPNGISLFTDASQKNYKSMVQYLGEISDIWDQISEKDQTKILQLLFAKTRAQAGAAIIKNFDQVRHALEEMENSAGSANAEMGVVMDTVDYKLNALKETWTGFTQNAISQENLGNIIDFLKNVSELLGNILNVGLKFSKFGGASGIGGEFGALIGLGLNHVGLGELTVPKYCIAPTPLRLCNNAI